MRQLALRHFSAWRPRDSGPRGAPRRWGSRVGRTRWADAGDGRPAARAHRRPRSGRRRGGPVPRRTVAVKRAIDAARSGWWLLRDNPEGRVDSRGRGVVAEADVLGVVLARCWPRPRPAGSPVRIVRAGSRAETHRSVEESKLVTRRTPTSLHHPARVSRSFTPTCAARWGSPSPLAGRDGVAPPTPRESPGSAVDRGRPHADRALHLGAQLGRRRHRRHRRLGLGAIGPAAAMPVMEGKARPVQAVRRGRRRPDPPRDHRHRGDHRDRCPAGAELRSSTSRTSRHHAASRSRPPRGRAGHPGLPRRPARHRGGTLAPPDHARTAHPPQPPRRPGS